MAMDVNVKYGNGLLVSKLQCLPDSSRPHHRADARVVKIILVIDRPIVVGEHKDTVRLYRSDFAD
jgi:hypothetical protein